MYNFVLRDSRTRHLENTKIFNDIEISQLLGDKTRMEHRTSGSSLVNLKTKEKKANEFLWTYCED